MIVALLSLWWTDLGFIHGIHRGVGVQQALDRLQPALSSSTVQGRPQHRVPTQRAKVNRSNVNTTEDIVNF